MDRPVHRRGRCSVQDERAKTSATATCTNDDAVEGAKCPAGGGRIRVVARGSRAARQAPADVGEPDSVLGLDDPAAGSVGAAGEGGRAALDRPQRIADTDPCQQRNRRHRDAGPQCRRMFRDAESRRSSARRPRLARRAADDRGRSGGMAAGAADQVPGDDDQPGRDAGPLHDAKGLRLTEAGGECPRLGDHRRGRCGGRRGGMRSSGASGRQQGQEPDPLHTGLDAAGGVPVPGSLRVARSSRTITWIEPAMGIATSAPRIPSSAPPMSTATSTTKAESSTVRR